MSKILYITVDTKPEPESVCMTVGRTLVNKLIQGPHNHQLEELNLYTSNIPEMESKFVNDKAELVTGEDYNRLSNEQKKSVDRIEELSDQFIAADIYVIAAPMWSLSFPSRLKQYIDCIALGNKFLEFPHGRNKPEPLLDDKERAMVYIQASGGDYPFWMEHRVNFGVDYCEAIFKGVGIKKFERILVEGTEQYEHNRDKYMDKANRDVDKVVGKLQEHTLSFA